MGCPYGNRRRIRGDRGRRLQRRRGELVERPFAHQYETGGLRRVWVRGHENVRKRVLIQAAGCNLGLLLRRLTGVGHAPEPAGAGSFGHLRTDRSPDRALGASDGLLGLPMDAGGAGRLNRSSPSCLNRSAQRIDFFHGLSAPILMNLHFCKGSALVARQGNCRQCLNDRTLTAGRLPCHTAVRKSSPSGVLALTNYRPVCRAARRDESDDRLRANRAITCGRSTSARRSPSVGRSPAPAGRLGVVNPTVK